MTGNKNGIQYALQQCAYTNYFLAAPALKDANTPKQNHYQHAGMSLSIHNIVAKKMDYIMIRVGFPVTAMPFLIAKKTESHITITSVLKL